MEIFKFDIGAEQQVSTITIEARYATTVRSVYYAGKNGKYYPINIDLDIDPGFTTIRLQAGIKIIYAQFLHVYIHDAGAVLSVTINDVAAGLEHEERILAIENTITSGVSRVTERATDTIDGFNTYFTTTTEFITNTARPYINGLPQARTDHFVEIDNKTIQLSDAPLVGDIVEIEYTI